MTDYSESFTYTGSDQTWTVPYFGVGELTVHVDGGGGGADNASRPGGKGQRWTLLLTPSPGDVFTIDCGQIGGQASGINGGTGGAGGGGDGGTSIVASTGPESGGGVASPAPTST